MIEKKYVDLYARDSKSSDNLIAERDVVLTYALRAILDDKVMDHLAFKGGTCLRKVVFGAAGRFSEDLDFTLDTETSEDQVLIYLTDVFNKAHYGIQFTLEDFYLTEEDRSFGSEVLYRHAWNSNGKFRLQVSRRERPTLPAGFTQMKPQSYFKYLEFDSFEVRAMNGIEMIAEKIRAAYQRNKVRDSYDLYLYAARAFDVDLLRGLVILKLWQVRDPFDPDLFFRELRGSEYDWEDLRRLIRSTERIDAEEILTTIESRFAPIRNLSSLEMEVIKDSRSGRNEPLAERLRAAIRERFGEFPSGSSG